jgi:hypothetical protein
VKETEWEPKLKEGRESGQAKGVQTAKTEAALEHISPIVSKDRYIGLSMDTAIAYLKK